MGSALTEGSHALLKMTGKNQTNAPSTLFLYGFVHGAGRLPGRADSCRPSLSGA